MNAVEYEAQVCVNSPVLQYLVCVLLLTGAHNVDVMCKQKSSLLSLHIFN